MLSPRGDTRATAGSSVLAVLQPSGTAYVSEGDWWSAVWVPAVRVIIGAGVCGASAGWGVEEGPADGVRPGVAEAGAVLGAEGVGSAAHPAAMPTINTVSREV